MKYEGEIDREGIGMLLAGGAGVAVGASISMLAEPTVAQMLGTLLILAAMGYEIQQRYAVARGGSQ